MILKMVRFRSLKFRPRIATTFRPHGKWGDLIVCIIPISWCANIITNSNFILRMIEWQSESGLLTVRIRGKQWYWVYKFELKTFTDIFTIPKNVGHNKWQINTPGDQQVADDYLHILQLRSHNRWVKTYWDDLVKEVSKSKDFHLISPQDQLKFYFFEKRSADLENQLSSHGREECFNELKFFILRNFFSEKLFKQLKLDGVDIVESLDEFLLQNNIRVEKESFIKALIETTGIKEFDETSFAKSDIDSSDQNLIVDEFDPKLIPVRTFVEKNFNFFSDSDAESSELGDKKLYLDIKSLKADLFLKIFVASLPSMGADLSKINQFIFEKINACLVDDESKELLTNILHFDMLDLKYKSELSDNLSDYIKKTFSFEEPCVFNFKFGTVNWYGSDVDPEVKPVDLSSASTNIFNIIDSNSSIFENKQYLPHLNGENFWIRLKNKKQNWDEYSEIDSVEDSYKIFLTNTQLFKPRIEEFEIKEKFFNSSFKRVVEINGVDAFLYNYSDFNEFDRFSRKNQGVSSALRLIKFPVSNKSNFEFDSNLIELFRFRYNDSDVTASHRLTPNSAFFIIRQKRYKRRKSILPRTIFIKDEEGNPTKRVKSSNYTFLNQNKIILENDFNATKRYKFFKKNKVRDELTNLVLSKRMLRTRRTLVLPAHVNITAITNSFDVIHSWFIPGLGIKMDAIPGRATHHTFYIDNVGFYYGQCAEICGRYHHHMPIRICALPFEHFLLWWQSFGLPKLLFTKNFRRYNYSYGSRKYSW